MKNITAKVISGECAGGGQGVWEVGVRVARVGGGGKAPPCPNSRCGVGVDSKTGSKEGGQ